MLLATAALLSAALSASAQPTQNDIVRADQWARECMDDDPSPKEEVDAWTRACLDFKDPCSTAAADRRPSIPRCVDCAGPAPRRASCGVPHLDRIQKTVGAAEGAVGLIENSEDCIKYFIKVAVWDKSREDFEDRAKNSAPPAPLRIACDLYAFLGDLREQEDDTPAFQAKVLEKDYPKVGRWLREKQGRGFKMCSGLALRDAAHYFQNYCDYREEWVVRNFPNVYCTMTAGYSAGKAIGIVPPTGRKKPSPPSSSEIYWGCSGIWDSQDRKFPYMADAETGGPP